MQPAPIDAHQAEKNSDDLSWLGIDMDTFVAGLQQRMPDAARSVCESIGDDLLKIHPVLRLAFKLWWETGEIPDLGEFSGYTVNDLMTGAKKTLKFEPTGLFLMLDTLIRDPEKAKEQLAHRVCCFVPSTEKDRVVPPMTRVSPSRRKVSGA